MIVRPNSSIARTVLSVGALTLVVIFALPVDAHQRASTTSRTGPVLHGGYTNPTGPTLPTTVVHRH